jgi:hypothetical protein
MESRTMERIAWSQWGLAPSRLVGVFSLLYQPINPQIACRARPRWPSLGMSRPLHARRPNLVKLEHNPTRMADGLAALGCSLEVLSSTSRGTKFLGRGPAPEYTS